MGRRKFGNWLTARIKFFAPIVVGFVAAPLAAAIGIASVAGTALVGAGLGVATAGATGQDLRQGAISGAVGGLISGASGIGQGGGAVDTNFGGQFGAPTTAAPQVGGAGVGTGGGSLAFNPGSNPALGAFGPGIESLGPRSRIDPVAEQAESSWGKKFWENTKGRIADPENAAGFALKLAAHGLAFALVNSGAKSPEEQQAYKEYGQYLETVKAQSKQVFDIQLGEAQKFLEQSKQYDPTYIAQQSANRTSTRDANALDQLGKSAALRGRPLTEGDKVRAALSTSENTGTAYDRGFSLGLDSQTKVRQAGIQALPTPNTSLATEFGRKIDNAQSSQTNRRTDQNNLVGLFGEFGKPNEDDVNKKRATLSDAGS